MITQDDLERFGDFCLQRGADFREGRTGGYRPELSPHRGGNSAQWVRKILELWEEHKEREDKKFVKELVTLSYNDKMRGAFDESRY